MSGPKKISFKPSKYGSKVSTESTPKNKSEDKIVTKGGNDVKIDLRKINDILEKLKRHGGKQIRHLDGELQEDFRQIVIYVNLLYDTEHYNVLHDLVKHHFNDTKDIEPGTIKAYFGGCLANNKIEGIPGGCTPVCTGSMPIPKKEAAETGWQFCDSTVILGLNEDGKIKLTVLNKVKNSEKALLFINVTNANAFPGLSDDEKEQLIRMGVREVKIFGYSQNSKNYVPLTDNYIPIGNVKSRLTVVPSFLSTSNGTDTGAGTNNTALMVLVIVVVLLLLFLIWRMLSRRNNLNY